MITLVKLKAIIAWLYKHRQDIASALICIGLISALAYISHVKNEVVVARQMHTDYVQQQKINATRANTMWEIKLDQANQRYDDRIKALERTRVDLATHVNRVSESVSTAERKYVTASTEAKTEYAHTISELFRDCVSTYQGLAVKADQHAIDVERLSDAWPTPVSEPPS